MIHGEKINSVIHSFIEKNIFFILRFSLLPRFIRETFQRRTVTFIMYHDIAPEIADTHFTELRKNYTIISLRDFLEAKKTGRSDTLPQKSLVITFDDGHRNNYSLKPIIEKHKVPVVIFLCAGIVGTNRHFWWQHGNVQDIRTLKSCSDEERLNRLALRGFNESEEYEYPQGLTHEEITTMAQSPLINFQSHSLTHPCLPACSPEKAFHEISSSKQVLESMYSFDIYAFAYPNGDYSDREIAFLKKSGYLCGLTCDPGFNDDTTPLCQLKRLSMNSNSDVNELIVRASGLWALIQRITMR